MLLFELKVFVQKSVISKEFWSKTHAKPIEIVSNGTKHLKTQAENSRGWQIHLFCLPPLGRISKPVS